MTIDELIAVINGSTQHKTLYHFTDEANPEKTAKRGHLPSTRASPRAQSWSMQLRNFEYFSAMLSPL
jgi:hypothetical protein